MIIFFHVDGKPQGKGRPRYTTINGHASAYTPASTRDYEDKIRAACRKAMANGKPIQADRPVGVTVEAVFPIPKSYGKRKSQGLYGKPYTHKPDADNVVKSVLDAGNGVAFEDDSQVTNIRSFKRYIFADEQPHIEVSIKTAE